jgi:hypothetical protein
MNIGGIQIEIDTTDELIAAENDLTRIASLLLKTRLQQCLEVTGKRSQIPDFNILKSYAGLLAMGKTEFAKIEQFLDDKFWDSLRSPRKALLRSGRLFSSETA